jgi:hypothetical protein
MAQTRGKYDDARGLTLKGKAFPEVNGFIASVADPYCLPAVCFVLEPSAEDEARVRHLVIKKLILLIAENWTCNSHVGLIHAVRR